ncbi:aldo/keto reductase [Tateyamaria omphalii]|uniref:aldo/keto reductase n=1 Tax=Tateyamaria omphalii TaxID=299262 RepID=UPI001C9A1CA3|nr:aldo/keto reductase [Tateyamaria omphalii]MBY5934181.1 aldo/keto reductase [Tateyamaria omphalii]
MSTDKTTSLGQTILGRGGLRVSRMGLGTMTFGVETEAAEAHGQLDLFIEHGGTLIDTADGYGAGASEEIIGAWGKARGGMDDLIIATKGRFAPPPGSTGASRRSLVRSIDASLKRLQVEAIDLYYVHGWDKDTDIADTLGALGDLRAAGKLHHVGWSNLSAWQLQKLLAVADRYNLPKPIAVQPQYNLLERGIELELMPCCLEEGIALVPWSPLGGGWLTGKYSADARPVGATRLGEDPARGVEAYDLRNTGRTHAVLKAVSGVATETGRPAAHVALAWLAARPGVSSILLGARTLVQLKDNLAAADLTLTDRQIENLTTASALPALPYPYNFLQDWCDMKIWKRLGT